MSKTLNPQFDGRVAIVTGGAQGIGRAISEKLVKDGAAVVIADLHEDKGRATQEELSAIGDCTFLRTDVSDEGDIVNVVRVSVEKYNQVDFLVNNAAVFIMRGLDASLEEWRRIMDVNVIAYALCAKHTVPEMLKVGGGVIINMASISGVVAQPGYMTYNTSKAAVLNMTRCMALDLASKNVRVNAVCPGTVWTAHTAEFLGQSMGLDKSAADAHPEIGGPHMLSRTAYPEEIARAVVFLISDDASFITAECLMVDGGYTAQ